MTRWPEQNIQTWNFSGVLQVFSNQWLSKVVEERKQWKTVDRVMGGQDSLMYVGNEGCMCMWS